MTYRTHKQYSIAFAYITLMLLYSFKLCKFNYYLCFPPILLISQWGAKFPDLDHEFKFIKDKNVLTWTINKIIHITGGKHRSWQTHSWDVCIVYSVGAYFIGQRLFKGINLQLFYLINYAFVSGWVSHLFSDMLNGMGVRVFCWNGKHIAFVPKKFLGFEFRTGGEWEEANYKVLRLADVILGVISLVYPWMPQILEKIK